MATETGELVCKALAVGSNVLVLGEAGQATAAIAVEVADHFSSSLLVATSIYKGSVKQLFKQMASQLDIPTENEDDKPLNVDDQKQEILDNLSDRYLLILPESKRLPASVRYWLEDAIAAGVRCCLFAPVNPGRDIYLDLLEIELELPGDRAIREEMQSEADRLGIDLSRSELAELQPLAGRNPALARKVVRQHSLGIRNQQPEHTQYVVIMPVVIACLMAFGIIRFVGMGTQNKQLYIFGGCALVAGMTLKQLGGVRGARKRRGQ